MLAENMQSSMWQVVLIMIYIDGYLEAACLAFWSARPLSQAKLFRYTEIGG
jgi:hypothetical protein